MSQPNISVPDLQPYNDTFSFTTSRLLANIKRTHPTYAEHDPKTWPYITLETLEKHGTYDGYPNLPEGVAYEQTVMLRYTSMYSAGERASSATLNGSFHKRYPFNFTRCEALKDDVSMSFAEYAAYRDEAAAVAQSQLHGDRDMDIPRDTQDQSDSTPLQAIVCPNRKCAETRREIARLRASIFDKASQLQTSQRDLIEYETTASLRKNSILDARFEVKREHARADQAEQEGVLGLEMQMKRIKELERRLSEAEAYGAQLEMYCNGLEARMEMCKVRGRRARPVVYESESEDGELGSGDRPGERGVRLEDLGGGEESGSGDRASERVKLEDSG
ncbi:hypothetical protein BDW02DRAFT_550563 [Decorospora gaudefroyi]|uniref:Uncharacterized protein n=1 Tax=Decorospora gaudefroyi TaxID=184978 RepID=A0A6A5KAP2_9PLEO|nr:hypothetical protein BDW02DRAFT_550563 [Decorospora gaudefroyi]